jgi:predicted nuclease of predicted toxin-antitoxin system
LHVNTTLDKWFITAAAILKFSDSKNLILIIKDFDFKNSFLINKKPRKLIKINLGNISTNQLIKLFDRFMPEIELVDNKNFQYMIEIESQLIKVTIA